MTEIKKAEDLVAVSIRQGLQMNLVEADIVLGYIESGKDVGHTHTHTHTHLYM